MNEIIVYIKNIKYIKRSTYIKKIIKLINNLS